MAFMGIQKISPKDEEKERAKFLASLLYTGVYKKAEELVEEAEKMARELRVEDFSFSFDVWAKDADQAADIAKRLEMDVEGIEVWGNGRATIMVYGGTVLDIRDLNKLLRINGIEVL